MKAKAKTEIIQLNLHRSTWMDAARLARLDEVSLSDFILLAVAEKIARSQSKVPLVN